MATSDALRVVEDWISEHYFTSDAPNETFHKRVLERRKAWDAAEQPTSKSRITGSLREILAGIANLYPDATSGETQTTLVDDDIRARAASLYRQLRTALGFETGEFHHDVATETAEDSPVRRYAAHGLSEYPLAIVDAVPAQTLEDLFIKDAPTLLSEWTPDDETDPLTSVSRALSQLFTPRDGNPAEFALVMAGRWLVVAEAARWQQGRYLGIDLQTVLDRNDTKRAGELDTAITCIDAESLAPDQDGKIWWADTLEDSTKHTAGVSADLREGVRTSIEIIANEVVARRRIKNLLPLPDDQAQPLAKQALRFLYRILFLLYAEASPQLGILPVGAPEYEAGYSIDRLRDLLQVKLTTQRSKQGTHLYESLGALFGLIDHGHQGESAGSKRAEGDDAVAGDADNGQDAESGELQGLEFNELRADLFKPEATAHIDTVGLGNDALQRVLSKLLLTKEKKGRDRGYISYVELGINQLGAVYEGLMSYTGFFASEELYEVAHDGDPSKGSWVVPVDRAGSIDDKDFVKVDDPDTGERRSRRYDKGEFVFRLSGRERQQSASYYTPEVLTRFTVGQALEELLDQDGVTTPADDILQLTICEPALGSGAFAIEAVNQLAEQYLERKQNELGQRIDPEDRPAELQKVKASIALHQVYGVDLNATAVEFAEITLWLSSMAKGLQAPWFGLHLRRGNSLIGARRAVYRRDQIMSKSWLTTPPTDVALTDIDAIVNGDRDGLTEAAGRIPHWLLPAAGWGSTAESKEAKNLVPEKVKGIKAWRRRATGKPNKKEVDRLVDLGYQVEELWTMAYRRLTIAKEQTRRDIPLWGQGSDDSPVSYVTREQIEASLSDPDGAYQRLRRVMDAWCALWFWPLTTDVKPPEFDEWLSVAEQILGTQSNRSRKAAERGAESLAPANEWEGLADQENFELAGAGAAPHVDDVVDEHPWLGVCERVAAQQGFFHWQLDFATVFGKGGFDLQLGNPPWVRPDSNVDALLAEGDPWWTLTNKPTVALKKAKREQTLALPGMTDLVTDLDGEVLAQREYVGSDVNFPVLSGLRPDLYRCFMEQVWDHQSSTGISSLIHLDTHFTDDRAGNLRNECYVRLRRHWQFINELKLFEIQNEKTYGVNVYGTRRSIVEFDQATALYMPSMVENSYRHNGEGEEPGFKYQGRWDTRPHRSRIQRVTDETLKAWSDLVEDSRVPTRCSRMVNAVNREVADVLARLAGAGRVGDIGLTFSSGWNETTDRASGYFVQEWGVPQSWDDVIIQGPHIYVANPIYKTPNRTMKSHKDWTVVDFEHIDADKIPITAYKPSGNRERYENDFTHWDGRPARMSYRLAWRAMAANTGERTLIPAIIPPGAAHVHTIRSVGAETDIDLVFLLGIASSLLSDFVVRSVPRAHILLGDLERLSLPSRSHSLIPALILRALRLNCLTNAYADLWAECWDPPFARDSWTFTDHTHTTLGEVGPEWSMDTPLRRDADRRQALVEIDSLVALMLGIPAEELCTVYRTQFGVLYDYDHGTSTTKYIYDANGRVIPNSVYQAWKKKGDNLSWSDRTATNASGYEYTYKLPFQTYDREEDMTRAYREFERRLKNMGTVGTN
ncbi:class I SAM-dependent DNA methyltransferase [Acidipropionibacterium acidipropionici]|uniref:class I SAM-dependent DNA methyltransferase n=1 Tax=Acidipropionibacterium acidipropionici TaxID=1748 RepID=UPI00110B85BC|nr:class I SAM-dependent DNA methyltransferase [Acidipropionibacterium acidipropionici]QCV96222.1 class I SAM-dependent DNA methyltransferase [Acidipropionibacterium acidipropionici]